MKSLTQRLHAYFIPQSYHADELKYRKARIFVNSAVITTLFAIFFFINTLLFDMQYHLYSMVVCSIAFFVLTFFLRWGIPLAVATHIFVGIAVIATFWNAYFLGGLQSYNFPWICFAPVLAILFGNPKIGWTWLFISLAAVLALGALQLGGTDFQYVINPRYHHFLGMNSLMALVLILFFIILVTEQAYISTLANLDLKSKIIEKSYSELKSAQAQLIQSEKMASLGQLTAGIAHEIKNPLNFVNNFSDVSVEMVDEALEEISKMSVNGQMTETMAILHDVKGNLKMILEHGTRADNIVKAMLLHSRGGSGKKEPTDINALADEYLRLAYHGMRASDKGFNAAFHTDFDDSIPKICLAPQDIGRVILNLVNNAFQAVAEKSKTVSAETLPVGTLPAETLPAETLHATSLQRNPDYQPTVTISTKNLGNQVEIRVKDNGPGIPDSIKEKIFQPFFTTKPTGQGTGLGLSLSYDIIKAHGGELIVETKDGEGTEFILKLSHV